MTYDYEKERLEAIEAGERALNSLRAAERELDRAGSWGLLDMLGGGLISTLAKHSKMDKAKADLERAKRDLRAFSRELQDVDRVCAVNIDTGDFLSFADWFFDGFIVDWMMQDRIRNAETQIRKVIIKVEGVLGQLRWQ